MTSAGDGPDRRAELASRLDRVESRITAACAAAGRDRADLTLVVVTKTYPAADVGILAELGVRHVGEARHPEAAEKVTACADAGRAGLTWHFVGALQTNKAAAVADYADLVHSVDRLKLVTALNRGAERAGRTVQCLVQVNLDPDAARVGTGGRSGASDETLSAVVDAVSQAPSLSLRGVMAVAPIDADPAEAFGRLAAVATEVAAAHPGADLVSAGMSEDLEQAVAAGATHLRVGRAVLGERPPLG